jgi:hypothetical protein
MVRRNTRQACVDLERMDREYRRQQAEGQAPDAKPVAAPDPARFSASVTPSCHGRTGQLSWLFGRTGPLPAPCFPMRTAR